jgi:hypothetical protein
MWLRRFAIGAFACATAGCGAGETVTGTAPAASSGGSNGGTASPGPSAGSSSNPTGAPEGGASANPSPSVSAAASASPGITSGGPLCLPIAPSSSLAPAQPLRFGVDVGLAGNLTPVSTTTPVPIDPSKEATALADLRPPSGTLVVRLNRLFWSGGEPLLQQFAQEAQMYAQSGYDVEVQVRYMPPAGDVDDISAWVAYVRHVVDVLGPNQQLVALTITNEVNFNVSPNTSDGIYPGAQDALIQGIEAAADEAQKDGFGSRMKMGFTFAYRFDPATDAELFDYIGSTGGNAFRSALGFVGIDDYPGTIYPPAYPPGDTAAKEVSEAIATMRDCYLPLAGITSSVPLWITENGYTSASSTASQVTSLTGTIDTVRALSGTYGVTDYRWFNFRDNDSSGTGTFDQDGLLYDTYAPKPSYPVYRAEIQKSS